jgi:hypothetical protein
MFQNISFQRKYQLLLLVSGLLMLCIYQFAISKTVDLYRRNNELNAKLAEAVNTPQQVDAIHKRLKALDKLIPSRKTDSVGSVHDTLLSVLSQYCKENSVLLKSFPETSTYEEGSFEIETNSFTLQGNFIPLLRLVYLLEQKERIGKISSLNFQSAKDYDSKRTVLPLTVYLQTVKNKQ